MAGLIAIAVLIALIQLIRTGVVYGCWALLAWAELPVGEPNFWAAFAIAMVLGAVALLLPSGSKS